MESFKSLVIVMRRRWLALLSLVLASVLVACGGAEAPAPEAEMELNAEPAASEAEPSSSSPRVFFVAPEDGATLSVDNPVMFEFGIENYELAAVPEEVEQPRPGMGHHHLGVALVHGS